MAQVTQLQATGTPGRVRTFVAKYVPLDGPFTIDAQDFYSAGAATYGDYNAGATAHDAYNAGAFKSEGAS